jgi:hypothetical protein
MLVGRELLIYFPTMHTVVEDIKTTKILTANTHNHCIPIHPGYIFATHL